MAAITGTVASAMGVAAIFNSCIDSFEYIQLSGHFAEDFGQCQLRLDVAKTRMQRWAKAVEVKEDPRFATDTPDENTAEQVHAILEEMAWLFQSVRESSKRYEIHVGQEGLERLGDQDMQPVFSRLHQARLRQKQESLSREATWALYDRRSFEGLIFHITKLIARLEKLFPAESVYRRMAELEVEEVDDKPSLLALQDVAASIDPVLLEAVAQKMRGIATNTCVDMAQLRGWVMHQLLDVSDRGFCTIVLYLDLEEFSAFMDNQYSGRQDINKVLTVTGSSQNAYANSAKKYVESTWGPTGVAVLEWFLLLFDATQESKAHLDFDDNDTLDLAGYYNGGFHSVKVHGKLEEIANIVLQITWIISAFRGPYKRRSESEPVLAMSFARVIYCGLMDGRSIFTFELQELQPVEEGGVASCWNHMFHTLVVASGFPIPPRPNHCLGIELPIGLMVTLAQLDCSLPFSGSFVLKGRTATAIPCEHRFEGEEQRCVPWHLVQTSDESDLGMERVLEKVQQLIVYDFPTEDLKEPPSLEVERDTARGRKLSPVELTPSFQKSVEAVISDNHRHFLGLYETARIELGTQDSDISEVASAVDDLSSPPVRMAWAKNVSTGASGSIPGAIGISISTTWQFSRETQGQIERSDPLNIKVRKACRRVGVLYNTRRRIAWLVPEIFIILHLMKARKAGSDFANVDITFPRDEDMTALNRQETVTNLLNGNEVAKRWFESFEKLFQQMKQSIIKSRQGLPLHFHSSTGKSSVSGVDFHAVATLPSWELRQIAISRERSGGWPSMIKGNFHGDQEDDILVFFCRDCRDYVVPFDQQQPGICTCNMWHPVRHDRDYLVMMGSAFLELTRRNGSDPPKLSRRQYWARSNDHPFRCHGGPCDRLQTLRTEEPKFDERQKWTELAAGFLGDEALVFGGRPEEVIS